MNTTKKMINVPPEIKQIYIANIYKCTIYRFIQVRVHYKYFCGYHSAYMFYSKSKLKLIGDILLVLLDPKL